MQVGDVRVFVSGDLIAGRDESELSCRALLGIQDACDHLPQLGYALIALGDFVGDLEGSVRHEDRQHLTRVELFREGGSLHLFKLGVLVLGDLYSLLVERG